MRHVLVSLSLCVMFLSGCESLNSWFQGSVDPLLVPTGGPNPQAYTVVKAEQVNPDRILPVPPVADEPTFSRELLMGTGARIRPDGRYLPLVLFPYDSWELTPKARDILQEAGSWLRTYDHGELAIEGHTDVQGTEAYNQALGFKRAKAVKAFLESLGVGGGAMKAISYGELDPICSEDSTYCDDMNRRAFVFVPRKTAPLLEPLTDFPLNPQPTK